MSEPRERSDRPLSASPDGAGPGAEGAGGVATTTSRVESTGGGRPNTESGDPPSESAPAPSGTLSDDAAASSSVALPTTSADASSTDEQEESESSVVYRVGQSTTGTATLAAAATTGSAAQSAPTTTSATRYTFTENRHESSPSTLSAVQAFVTSQVVRLISTSSSVEFSISESSSTQKTDSVTLSESTTSESIPTSATIQAAQASGIETKATSSTFSSPDTPLVTYTASTSTSSPSATGGATSSSVAYAAVESTTYWPSAAMSASSSKSDAAPDLSSKLSASQASMTKVIRPSSFAFGGSKAALTSNGPSTLLGTGVPPQSSSAAENISSGSDEHANAVRVGGIVGGVLAALVLALVLVPLCLFVRRRRNEGKYIVMDETDSHAETAEKVRHRSDDDALAAVTRELEVASVRPVAQYVVDDSDAEDYTRPPPLTYANHREGIGLGLSQSSVGSPRTGSSKSHRVTVPSIGVTDDTNLHHALFAPEFPSPASPAVANAGGGAGDDETTKKSPLILPPSPKFASLAQSLGHRPERGQPSPFFSSGSREQ